MTRCEVLDSFTGLFTTGQHEAFFRRYPNSRNRQDLVPGVHFRDDAVERLADFKTMGFNKARYSAVGLRGVIAPTDARTHSVHGEYVRKTHKLDTGRAAGGVRGRFEARLTAYDQTTGLVLGAFGEASTSLH